MRDSLRRVKKKLEKLDLYYSTFSSSNTYRGIRVAIDLINKEMKKEDLAKQLKKK